MTETRAPKGTGSIRDRGRKVEATYSYLRNDGTRGRRSRTFTTRTEARRWLKEQTAAGANQDLELTVAGYLTGWLAGLGMAQLEEATISWYRSAVNRHIIPALGSVKLARLTPVQIEEFLAAKTEGGRLDGNPGGLGPASVKRLSVTLGKALDAAVRKGMVPTNPARLADNPKMPARDVTTNVWSPEQIARFLEVVDDDRLRAVWRLAAMTGLRRSELCGLWWSDLDLDAGRLAVRRAVVLVEGPPVVKAPKTAGSRRTVDLDHATVAGLRDWRRTQLEERLRAGEAWAGGEWVAANELGNPIRPDWLGRRFAKIAAAADLPPISVGHLRHSHATMLLGAGINPKIVGERLGHSSITTTMDVYSAVLPTMQADAVARIAAIIEGLGGK